MRLKFFAIPAADFSEAEREVNSFLGSHRVLAIDRQLVTNAGETFWALCVQYLEGERSGRERSGAGKSRVDYKEVLPPEEFEVYAHLRRWRKHRAEKEGVPAYHLFTNEQLAAIVSQRISSLQELAKLSGIGPARLNKYGEDVLSEFRRRRDRLDSVPEISEGKDETRDNPPG